MQEIGKIILNISHDLISRDTSLKAAGVEETSDELIRIYRKLEKEYLFKYLDDKGDLIDRK